VYRVSPFKLLFGLGVAVGGLYAAYRWHDYKLEREAEEREEAERRRKAEKQAA
jgi:hypothetical protein